MRMDGQTDGFSALYSRRLVTTGTVWHKNFNLIKFYGSAFNCKHKINFMYFMPYGIPVLSCRCPMPTYGCNISLDIDVGIPS